MSEDDIKDTYYAEIERAVDIAYPMFNLFGWTYGNAKPTREELEAAIIRCVDSVLNKKHQFAMTGRFFVIETGGTIQITINIGEIYDDNDNN